MTGAAKRPVVAIDGPAGAGKSTVTLRVAQTLGYVVLDTGSLYRAVALAAQQHGADWDDVATVGAVAQTLASQGLIELCGTGSGKPRVFLRGQDVSQQIRSVEVSQGASKVSAIPAVRAALLDLQRDLGRSGGVVAEGRDVGTVVFPAAEAKFFLTASVDVRARRRHAELADKGEQVELDHIRREVEERDRRDSSRPVAPLRQAEDAELVDSSRMTIDEVVDHIVERVRQVEQRLNDAP